MVQSQTKIGDRMCCSPERSTQASQRDHSTVEITNENCLDCCKIPGGSGLLGTNYPKISIDGEQPLRSTKINSFYMDTYAVTNQRFAKFIYDTGYVTDAELLGDSFVFVELLAEDAPPSQAVETVPWWRVVKGTKWNEPFGPGSNISQLYNHPVVHVSWNDAKAFAKWAGGRLPTEQEWEHAARGGLGDVKFPWGDQEPNDTDFFPCNIWQGEFPKNNLFRDGYLGSAPVNAFAPNGYGLYNMIGNVWEYTSQPFKVRSLKKTVKRAHAEKHGYKLLKGGSFLCHASYCYRYRIAARMGNSANSSTSHQGFRLVYDDIENKS